MNDLIRELATGQLKSNLRSLLMMVVVWALLSALLADGWWHGLINIVGFLLTIFVMVAIERTLVVLGKPGWLAFPIALLLWGLAAIGLRSVILSVLA